VRRALLKWRDRTRGGHECWRIPQAAIPGDAIDAVPPYPRSSLATSRQNRR
jgi:hypothetical protein